MDHRPNVSLNNPDKPSKLLALLALVIAFALPFILVKSFPHKQKTKFNSRTASLPHIQEEPQNKPLEVKPQKVAKTKTARLPVSKIVANKPVAPVKPVIDKKNSDSTLKGWNIVKTRQGDSLASVFNRLGLSAKTLHTILKDTPHTKALTALKPNQELQFLIKHQTLDKLILPFTSTQYLVIYRDGQHYKSKINSRKMNSHNHFLTATVNGSLYSTAKRNNIPYKLVQQMTDIFTWEIDFAKEVRAGDQFTIIYKAFYIEDKLVGTGDILAVSYKSRGRTFQAVRHTSRDGHSDYYTPQGNGLKKAFNRYPIRFSHISSTFSLSRYHPILHYRRAHKGVDLAARIGTPIQATGDGRIEMIGRQSGYGNMIKISHNKIYNTIYGHMLKFQKGLSRGDFVRRGQIIGYVGQTGLASGPHCHYEFHINKQPKNPTTVDLPKSAPISGRELATFKANTNTLLAQLKLFENAHLASNAQKSDKRKG